MESWAELGNEAITWVLLYNHHILYLWYGPGSSTAISSTAVSSTLGSSNPVSSTNKYLDLLASIHYFLVRFMANPLYFERTWLGGQFAPAKWNVYLMVGMRLTMYSIHLPNPFPTKLLIMTFC